MPLVVDTFVLGPFRSNCYVVRSERGAAEAAVIDPGDDPTPLRLELARMGAKPGGILITHADVDHIGGVAALAEGTGAEVWAPAGEVEALRTGETRGGMRVPPHDPAHTVTGGDTVTVAGITFDVVDVPGHSIAHIAFHHDGELFAGDLLFAGWSGASTSRAATGRQLLDSVQALLNRFPADTVVYPGHGPATTLGAELATQPVPERVARRAARRVTQKFQAPRGTHDVLPSGRDVVKAPRCARSRNSQPSTAYGRIQTPGFQDTALFARTAGEGHPTSCTRRCNTFTDRQRPLADAAARGHRADALAPYIQHGPCTSEPQPVKAFTIAPMYRYGAPGPRSVPRRTGSVSVEAIGSSKDPAVDAEVIQLYHELLRRLGA